MSNTYLSRICIQDFRTFGQFNIDVPAAPGLVLVTGTNGLGKSSLFDAIEWGLTGKIRRFTPYIEKGKIVESDYLTRRGAAPNSHEVILTFSGNEVIERCAARVTPMSSIVSQLATVDRPAINDLGTYLALTHFLGQAAQERFTSRDSQEQWQALKGPSGIERLEQVRSGLRGRATVSAFTRRIEKEQSAVTDLSKQIADWQGWEARLGRLRQAARAVGSFTPDEVVQRTAVLEAELFNLLREKAPAITGETANQKLARLGDRLARAVQAFAEREVTVKQLADTIAPFTAAVANARMDHPVLLRSRQYVADTQLSLGAATDRSETVAAAVATQNTAIATIEQDISILEAARSDRIRRDELAAQIDGAQAELSSIASRVAERRATLAAADTAARIHADAVAEVGRLRSVALQARALVESHASLLDLEARTSQEALALTSAQQAASNAQRELESILVENDLLDRRINEAVVAHSEAKRHATAIGVAVSSIASHVHDDDTHCPVCRTEFDVGRLKLLANEAARSTDSRLAEASAQIEQLRSQAMSLKSRIEALRAVIGAPKLLERTWETSREIASAVRLALARALAVDLNSDLQSAANSRVESASRSLVESEVVLESLAAGAIASAEHRSTIAAELEEFSGREAQAASHFGTLRSEEQACSERLIARGMAGAAIDSLNTRLSAQRTALEVARAHLGQLADAAATLRTQLDAARDELVGAERALSTAESARADAEAVVNQIAQRWTRSQVEGTPSHATLDGSLAAVREMAAAVRLFNDRLQKLARDNQDVLLQEEITEVIEAMRASGGEGGLADPVAYLAELRAKELHARAALKLTKDAKKAVTSYTEMLKERVEDYSKRVLAPLNGLIDDFNDAMLSTPGESIQFKADHRVDATTFGMSLRYREPAEATIERQKDLPPQVVLSEGQLAANGFSILCAASTAYPWSRWRALLLDDPLQHNDIIHTAAFVDVMRNMVELRGYQLIMSSHDRGEGDFIARKFDAAGLPCSKIVLTAPSDKGVVYEGPEHNRAAKRIMQKTNDRTQSTA